MAGLDKQFQEVVLSSIRLWLRLRDRDTYSRAEHDALDLVGAVLREAWLGFATVYSGLSPTWSVDADHPGYIYQQIDGARLRVPATLAVDFPKPESLDELCQLAMRIRTDDSSVICVSGSSTQRGTLTRVGDIDYCEYIELDKLHHDIREALRTSIERARSISDSDLVCVRTRLGRQPPSERPWSLVIQDQNAEIPSHCKMDFVACTTFEGVVDVSNLVLPLVASETNPAVQHSFGAQEAPISSGAWVPRRLDDPLEIGRYAFWLADQIQNKLGTDVVKAAKRGLSLTRVLRLTAAATRIVECFSRNSAQLWAALNARTELRRKLAASTDDVLRHLIPKVDRTINRLEESLGDEAEGESTIALAQFAAMVSPTLRSTVAILSLRV